LSDPKCRRGVSEEYIVKNFEENVSDLIWRIILVFAGGIEENYQNPLKRQ
jgi:hypothetical protein